MAEFTKVIAYGCWVGNQNAFGRSSILSQPSDAGTASDVVCTRIRGKRPSELGYETLADYAHAANSRQIIGMNTVIAPKDCAIDGTDSSNRAIPGKVCGAGKTARARTQSKNALTRSIRDRKLEAHPCELIYRATALDHSRERTAIDCLSGHRRATMKGHNYRRL